MWIVRNANERSLEVQRRGMIETQKTRYDQIACSRLDAKKTSKDLNLTLQDTQSSNPSNKYWFVRVWISQVDDYTIACPSKPFRLQLFFFLSRNQVDNHFATQWPCEIIDEIEFKHCICCKVYRFDCNQQKSKHIVSYKMLFNLAWFMNSCPKYVRNYLFT